jgi:hypothetical protein
MGSAWKPSARPLNGQRNGTARKRRRARRAAQQAIPLADWTPHDAAQQQPEPSTVRDVFNAFCLVLLLATVVILWLLIEQLYGS